MALRFSLPIVVCCILSLYCHASPAPPPTTTTAAEYTFINQVPGYTLLSSCASVRVSQIIRGMSSGCGDGGAATSKPCFCQASRSDMESTIISAVSEQCNGTMAYASSAVDVFDSYCGATTTADAPGTGKHYSALSALCSAKVLDKKADPIDFIVAQSATAGITKSPPEQTSPRSFISSTVASTASMPESPPSASVTTMGGTSGRHTSNISIGEIVAIAIATLTVILFAAFWLRRYWRAKSTSKSRLQAAEARKSRLQAAEAQITSVITTCLSRPEPRFQKLYYRATAQKEHLKSLSRSSSAGS